MAGGNPQGDPAANDPAACDSGQLPVSQLPPRGFQLVAALKSDKQWLLACPKGMVGLGPTHQTHLDNKLNPSRTS